MATKTIEKFEEVIEDTSMMPVIDVESVMSKDGNMINTMNLATVDGKIDTINALNAAISLKDAKDTVLDICDCITMPGIRKGRNGMPDVECTNTYLIDTSKQAWFTQSDGIARSVKMIAMMFPDFGKNNPDGCLHVRVQENNLANGNTIKSLVINN